jgi:hypothetical protein
VSLITLSERKMGERKLNTGSGFLVLALALILPATSDVTSSYVTLTRDGYQNVVVSIEENSGFSDCQEGLEAVKVKTFDCQLIADMY